MEEVDKIILQNLKSLGWESDDGTRDLKNLEINDIAKGISKCLMVINEDYDVPQSLPHNMAQRFRAAASLAEAIKGLGYTGDVGYQTILYPSEHDLRKLFMFLIEKLPKESSVLQKEPLGRKDYLHKKARAKIAAALKRPWLPPHCLQVTRKWGISSDDVSLAQYGVLHCTPFSSSVYSLLGEQVKEDNKLGNAILSRISTKAFYPSILSSHSHMLAGASSSSSLLENGDRSIMSIQSGSEQKPHLSLLPMSQNLMRFLLAERKMHDLPPSAIQLPEESVSHSESKDLVMETRQKLLDKRDDIQKDIHQLTADLQEANVVLSHQQELIAKNEAKLLEMNDELSQEEKHFENLKKASQLTLDPLSNIEKLKSSLISSEKKEEKLLAQWLEYKEELESQLRELSLRSSQRKSKRQEMLEEVSEIKDRMKDLGAEAVRKQALLVQLKQQFESLPKGVNRSVYTKRILDISGKVRKQKAEIDKVIGDIRSIQKEMNTLTGKLERTFAVVEDVSFKVSSSNEKARPIYRTVVSIHDMCGELVDIVRDTGIIQREVAEFKLQLDAEKNKKVEEILRQLQDDLTRVKNENAILKKKLSTST